MIAAASRATNRVWQHVNLHEAPSLIGVTFIMTSLAGPIDAGQARDQNSDIHHACDHLQDCQEAGLDQRRSNVAESSSSRAP